MYILLQALFLLLYFGKFLQKQFPRVILCTIFFLQSINEQYQCGHYWQQRPLLINWLLDWFLVKSWRQINGPVDWYVTQVRPIPSVQWPCEGNRSLCACCEHWILRLLNRVHCKIIVDRNKSAKNKCLCQKLGLKKGHDGQRGESARHNNDVWLICVCHLYLNNGQQYLPFWKQKWIPLNHYLESLKVTFLSQNFPTKIHFEGILCYHYFCSINCLSY